MEVLREGWGAGELAVESPTVSILVLMEVLREGKSDGRTKSHQQEVSILVLMEVLREVETRYRSLSPPAGFNPCFNGSVERGLHQVDRA